MMQAPRDPSKFTKMICIESFNFVDVVWGNCSIIKGQSYDILIESSWSPQYYLVKFGTGLCPHEVKRLKSESEIRDEKLNDILK